MCTLIFSVEKNEGSFCNASHIFSTKNIGIFEIFTFEILTTHYDIVSFERPGPGMQIGFQPRVKE